MASKDNFFGMRMDDDQYRALTDFSRERGLSRSQVVLDLLERWELIPDLPEFYVERLARIASSKPSLSISKLISLAVQEKFGSF
jgi:hypothetical protein